MEQLFETLTPGQVILVCIGALLAVAAAINTLGSAAEKIAKARNAAKAPNEALQAELDALQAELDAMQEWKKEVDRRLESGNVHFDAIDASDRVTKLALLALLDHSIDGNNIQQMQEAKAELQQHLINR